jgi:adenine deaminase
MQKISGNIVDVVAKKIFAGEVHFENGKIIDIIQKETKSSFYILPGLVDSHVHIESSMCVPSEFAKIAVSHGTIAVVTDPHEIANVLGVEGVKYMIDNANRTPFKFFFGIPSCVPATDFETSSARIDADDVECLLKLNEVVALSEMMNFPGVIFNDKNVHAKINAAKKLNKKIDGHAPCLNGESLKKYVDAGISTDHECMTLEEAIEKIELGMKIQIREGSAAKNFEALYKLIDLFPNDVMLCTDDSPPEDLLKSHINKFVHFAKEKKLDFFNTFRAATYNPIKHYNLNVGLLQKGDEADFIIVDNLDNFNILTTYIKGNKVFENGTVLFDEVKPELKNNFVAKPISKNDVQCYAEYLTKNIIEIIDKELFTKKSSFDLHKDSLGNYISDPANDILKIVVYNRYSENSKPAVAFVKNTGLRKGAIASSIAHDSHNVIAIGSSDEEIVTAINKIVEMKGGIVVVNSDGVFTLTLPIAGIMSDEKIEVVAKKYEQLKSEAIKTKCSLTSPFMTLSFLSLLVIPEIKLGDRGLFDVGKFEFING